MQHKVAGSNPTFVEAFNWNKESVAQPDMPGSRCTIFKVIRSLLLSHCTATSVSAVFTMHDYTIERIADNSVWYTNCVSLPNVREK